MRDRWPRGKETGYITKQQVRSVRPGDTSMQHRTHDKPIPSHPTKGQGPRLNLEPPQKMMLLENWQGGLGAGGDSITLRTSLSPAPSSWDPSLPHGRHGDQLIDKSTGRGAQQSRVGLPAPPSVASSSDLPVPPFPLLQPFTVGTAGMTRQHGQPAVAPRHPGSTSVHVGAAGPSHAWGP